MDVQIVALESNEVIVTYPMVVSGQNFHTQVKDFHNIAWGNAVADGLVDANDREKYTFHLVGPLPE